MWIKIVASTVLGGVVVFGAALASKSTSPPVPDGATSGASDPASFAVISHGEEVSLLDHVDPGGKYTVFLFGADW